MGVFEMKTYATGTIEVCKAISSLPGAYTVIGVGILHVQPLKMVSKMISATSQQVVVRPWNSWKEKNYRALRSFKRNK